MTLTNIKGLFGMNGEVFINDYTLHYLKSYLPVLIIALFGATPFIKILIDKLRKNKYVNNIINILEPILIVMILFIIMIHQFLYMVLMTHYIVLQLLIF